MSGKVGRDGVWRSRKAGSDLFLAVMGRGDGKIANAMGLGDVDSTDVTGEGLGDAGDVGSHVSG